MKNDTDADALWRHYAAPVQGYTRRHCPADLVDDVVAETFLVAWRRRDVLPDDVLPWLFVTARNIIKSMLRKAAREQEAPGEMLTRVAVHDGTAERLAMLEAAARLSEAEREALLLVGWDGLTMEEAATVSGCSTSAFKMRLQRARVHFEEMLNGSLEGRHVG